MKGGDEVLVATTNSTTSEFMALAVLESNMRSLCFFFTLLWLSLSVSSSSADPMR